PLSPRHVSLFFLCSRPPRTLSSFPTRRSSDLLGGVLAFLDRLHLLNLLKRRPECGSPCHLCERGCPVRANEPTGKIVTSECFQRSEEHTSELQSLRHLVCRLLLEKKNDTKLYT